MPGYLTQNTFDMLITAYEKVKKSMHMRTGKKMILGCAIAAAATVSQAQTVSYKVSTNDANDYKRTMLYIDVFTADYYLTPTIGSALKLETMVGGRIMPWAKINFAWFDAATSHAVSGYPTNAGGQKKQLITDLGAAFYLTNKVKTKKVKVVLSSHKSGNTTYSKYLRIPGEVKTMFGVEGGVNIARKALEFEDDSHEFYSYKSVSDGSEQPIGSVGGGSASSPAGEFYKPLSMTTVFSIYGGIHLRKITNLTILAGSYGARSNRNATDLYADIMYAPAVSISNVVDIAGKEWQLAPQAGGIRHLGWRAGFIHHNSQKVSFSYNFEFGQKPGPVMGKDLLNNGTYISLGMGLTVGSNKFIGVAHKKKKDGAATPTEPAN